MKKIMIIAGMLSLVFLASCGQKAVETVQNTDTESQQPAQVVEVETETETPIALNSGFSDYDSSLLGEKENTVLFFHSASCGSCRATEKNLLESEISDDLQVLKVNFDEDKELRKKYSVPKYHNFVQVDADGNEIKKWSGSFTLEDIREQLESSNDEVAQEDEEVVAELVEESEAETPVALAGQYSDYDSSLLGATDNTVLFFHAAWCGKCNTADDTFAGSDVPDDLTLLKVDFDNSGDLRKKYGVTSQHTFVQVDADGNLVSKWLGSKDLAGVQANIK